MQIYAPITDIVAAIAIVGKCDKIAVASLGDGWNTIGNSSRCRRFIERYKVEGVRLFFRFTDSDNEVRDRYLSI